MIRQRARRMVAKKVPMMKLEYPKHWFLTAALLWALATALFVYLSVSAVEDFSRMFWACVAAVEAPVVFVMFVLPLFTSHAAGAKGLRLRMGVLVRDDVPYEWIRRVDETSLRWGGVRVGIGVRYASITKLLFITSSFRDLVEIEFDSEHRLGGLLKRPVTRIIMSVKSARSAVDLLRERAGLPRE